jgi:hypothetical protein
VLRLNARRIARRVASLLGGLCDRPSRASLWIAATIVSRRPTLRDLKRVNPAVAAMTLLLFLATTVLDRAGLLPHRPDVVVGLAAAAFAAGWAVSRLKTPRRRRRGDDQSHRQGQRA